MNPVVGIVGAFNLQGSHWSRTLRRFATFDRAPKVLGGSVSAADVEVLREQQGGEWPAWERQGVGGGGVDLCG